ncbi:LysR family transcriptional regulator ArgP [Paracoccus sp. Z330]|uniref:LysR family transcriptional regulator ArgP n=1 Tax=Paracoccus onchidii TaxID=3017813 RepID=A0ABT4ZJA4_9RHOB|nr:LysR family transcriptional regulator ArgP [Paracoccus onchidii]MDB6179440.1 LysR family transcriptional regulator ArgP [Paracoccus onchidii]
MFDYPALLALAEILRRGSFEAAAHALSVTPSAISQRIRSLEERSGTTLIDRGPPITGTAEGLRLAAHLEQVRLLETALQLQQGETPTIRVAVSADSLATWAMDPLAQTPGLLDLVIDDQDHAHDWLKNGQVSAALTGTTRPVTGCDSLPLGKMRYRATASPDFMQLHFPDGPSPATLKKAPSLSFNHKDGLQDRWVQEFCGHRIALPLNRIPSSQAFAEATRLGLGWGMNPEAMVKQDLLNGRLVDLAPDLPLDVPLAWQTARMTAGAIAPLTEAMKKAASAALLP